VNPRSDVGLVVIVPARQGSKRVPGKNTRSFLGKPLIEFPLRSLVARPDVEGVYVSTDSIDTQRLSVELGAQAPFIRAPDLSGDYTSTIEVIRDAIDRLQGKIGLDSLVMCAYPAAILDKPLWDGIFQASKSLGDSVLVTVGKMRNSPQRALLENSDGSLSMSNPEFISTRTQDLTPAFYDAGKVYVARARVWQTRELLLSGSFIGYELPFWAAQDIDTLEDWDLAESLIKDRV
jgi:CMP-N-acetylneuraminic acid synthetase